MFKKNLYVLPATFLIPALLFFIFSCHHHSENESGKSSLNGHSSLLDIEAQSLLSKGHSDSAVNILLRARTIAIGTNDTLALAYTSFKLGEILVNRADYNSAETYIREAVASYELLKKEYKTASTYNLYGGLLIARNDNMKAQEYLIKAADIFKRLSSLDALGAVYVTIADNNHQMGNDQEAAKYYNLAIAQLALACDTSNLRTAYINMGVMYRKTFPDSALACYRKAIALLAASDPAQSPIMEKYNIANLYLDQKQYAKALEEYNMVFEYCRRIELTGGIVRVFSGYASVYQETGKDALAVEYLYKAIRIADSIGDRSLALQLRQELMEDYRKQGNYKSATLIADTIKVTRDTLTARDNKAALQNLEQLYQAEKKELENTILKASLKNEKDRSLYRWIITASLSLALMVMLYLYRKSRRLHTERTYAYEALMKRFKEEIGKPEESLSPKQKPQEKNDKNKPEIAAEGPLLDQLIAWFISEKPYLDPKLKVEDVAEKLNTSQKVVATALKAYKNSNFNSFTNQFRVEEAKKRLENPEYRNYKITAIALDSGFGSKQSFYTAFEQATGIKPSYYRRNLFNETETTES